MEVAEGALRIRSKSAAWVGSQIRIAVLTGSWRRTLPRGEFDRVATPLRRYRMYHQTLSQGLRHNNGCRDRNHPWAMRVIHDPVNPLSGNV